jgi:hypothetical protein
MSGVGCVQEDCFSVPNAKLSYTSACICLDGFKGCYEPVDSSGVACGPNCPASRLVSCVNADTVCAGEAPVGGQPTGEQPANAAGPDTAGTTDSDAPSSNDRTATVSVDNLVKDLEEFLAGKGVSGPTPGKAAAAGAALSTLIGTWVLVNAASGANIADLLRAVQKWRFGPNASAPTGTPAAAKAPAAAAGTKQAAAPAISLSTSGTIPGQKPAGTSPAPTPAQKQKPPAQPGKGKPPGTPEVTPEKLETLRRRFQQVVSQKMKEGHYVRNTDFLRKAWNQVPGRFLDLFSGHKGGQCDEYARWGKQWSEQFVRELFGDGAIVDHIAIHERSTRVQYDLEDEIDALFVSSHGATRVTLPNGDCYILDYWDAIGDRQVKWGTDVAYQQIFGEPAPRQSIQLIPQNEWIKTWREKIGWDDTEVRNLTYAQEQLKASIRHADSEAEGIEAWRNMRSRGVPDHQMETVINDWHKNGVWWER